MNICYLRALTKEDLIKALLSLFYLTTITKKFSKSLGIF